MRTTIISTSKLRTYKILMFSFSTLLCLIFLIALFNHYGTFGRLFWLAYFGYMMFLVIRSTKRLKNVSFDDYSVFYERDGFEVQIPFNEIKDIDIMTLDGIYKINLFQANQDGKTIHFKTSLWYPLNFKRQDEHVNVLRAKIARYKRNMAPAYNEQLPGRRI